MKYEDKPIPFGKYKGQLICDCPKDYLEFLIDQDWFRNKFKDLADLVKQELEYRKVWGFQNP